MTRAFAALRIALLPSLEDEILTALHEAGTLGIEIVDRERPADSSREPSPGPLQPVALAYFDRRADLATVRAALGSIADGLVLGAETIAEEPWVERQQASRRPIAVGERFLIVPDPARAIEGTGPEGSAAPERHLNEPRGAPSSGGRIVLVVPVGRAFGTGEHETTRLCLEEIERRSLAGLTVLDLGTGSGVLAMAAARLGARRVVGLDNDPEAAEIAAENVRANGLAPLASGGGSEDGAASVTIVVGDLGSISGPFDLIVANLFPGALEQARAALAACQPHSGTLVISGFSPAEASGLAREFAGAGYRERGRRALGEWAALVLTRTG